MSEKFDPYHRWLAIPQKEQPPNHYRLLGLAKFESDVDVIDTAADRQMAHVRTYQSGKYADESQRLLNEISGARVVLLDADKKAAYDAGLREQDKPLKQALPLATAQPLEAAAPAPQIPPAHKPQSQPQPKPQLQPASHVATPASAKVDASNIAPLLLAGGAGLLVLLLAAGVGAWMIFGGSEEQEQVVIVDEMPPVEPVVPPVRPVDPPNNVTPVAPVNPPVTDPINDSPIDDPTNSNPHVDPPDDEPAEPFTPVDEPPAESPPSSEPPLSPIAALFAEEEADERAPLPDEATQKEKREQVEGLFAVSSARSAAQRAGMAQKLLDTARDTKSDLAAQYVLLEIARDVAGDGGHVALAMEAIDELNATFQIDGPTLRAQSLAQAAPAVMQNSARSELVETGIRLVDELFAADKYVDAAKLIKALQSIAAKTRDKEQRAKLSARQEQGSELFKGFKDAQVAIETLKKTPDDAAAALVAGRYYAFIKGDWQRGLVLLSLSNDAKLKSLAEKEMQTPRSSEDRIALADAWLKQAGDGKGLASDRQRARAAMWFGKVRGGLTGLAKVELQRKLAAIGELGIDGGEPFEPMVSPTDVAASTRPTGQRGKPVDLLALVNPQRDAVSGEFRRDGTDLVFPTLAAARLAIPYRLPRSYVLEVETTRTTDVGATADFAIGLMYRGKPCTLAIDAWVRSHSKLEVSREGADVPVARFDRGPLLVVGKKSKVVCEVDDERLSVSVDGKQVLTYEGDATWDGGSSVWKTPSENVVMLGGYNAPFIVHSMKLISGDEGSAAVGAHEAVDLLALVDVDKHSVQAKYSRRGKSIICPEAGFSPILIPYHPPAEYQLTVNVTRKKEAFHGHDMAIGLVYQGKQCVVLIDRITSTARGQASWSTISANGAGDLASITNDDPVLKSGRRSRVVCTVSKNSIHVSVDGKNLLSYSGPARGSGIDGPWGVPDREALMLGGLQEPFEFHSMLLTPGSAADEPVARGKSVDLLALVDAKRHGVLGDWRIVDGELVSPRIPDSARLQIPAKVPDEYDLDLEVTRNGGGNELAIGMIYQGKQCSVGIDRYSARSTDILGEMNGSPPEVAKAAIASVLKPGERSKVKCAVRKNSITIFVNDAEIVSYRGDARWSGLNSGWAVPDKTALMLGAWWAEFHIHSFKLTPLAQGSGGAIGATMPDWRVGTPIDLLPLIDVAKDSVHGDWKIVDGKLVVKAMELSRLQIPIIPPKNYVLEVEATRTDGKTDLLVGLVYQDRLCAAVFDGWGGGISGLAHDRDFEAPKISRPAFAVGQRSKIVCTVTDKSLLIAQDGKEVFRFDRDANWEQLSGLWRMPKPQALMLGAQSGFTIHSIKLTPQKELPTLLSREGSAAEEPDGAPINLLPLVDLKVDAAQGKWDLAGDSLSSPDDAETGIRLPYIPAQEYDLNLDIKLASTTVDIELRLPYFGNHFMLHIDSSSDAKPGEARPFRCEVRKTGITVFHNGKQAAKVDRDSAKPLRDNAKTFEIITQNTPATFSRIRLTELGPGGRPLRGGAAKPAAESDKPNVGGANGSQKLQVFLQPPRPVVSGNQGVTSYLIQYIDPKLCTAAGSFSRPDSFDKLTLAGEPFTSALVPFAPPDEYLIQFKATRIAGDGPLVLNLPLRGKPCTVVLDAPGKQKGLWPAGANAQRLDLTVSESPFFPRGETIDFSCDMRTGKLHIHRNGQPYMKLDDWPKWSGVVETFAPPKPEGFAIMCRDSTFVVEALCYVPWGQAEDLRGELGLRARKLQPMDSDIDLIKYIDLDKDKVRGEWVIRKETLVSPNGFSQLLRIPCKPPMHYRLDVEVTRVSGDGEFVFNTPLPGGGNANLVFDTGDIKKSASSSWSIYRNNEQPKHTGVVLAPGRRTKLSIVVGDNSFQVQADGRRLMGVDGALNGAGGNSDRTPPIPTFLAVGASQTEFHIHSLTLTPLSIGGRLLNVPQDEAN